MSTHVPAVPGIPGGTPAHGNRLDPHLERYAARTHGMTASRMALPMAPTIALQPSSRVGRQRMPAAPVLPKPRIAKDAMPGRAKERGAIRRTWHGPTLGESADG